MYLGEIISFGTALCWTFTVIGFESAGRRVGSIPVNIIRLFFAFFFLSVTTYVISGHFLPHDLSSYSWNMLLISGMIGFVIGDLFLFQAFIDIGGRISLLIYSSVPIMSSILGYFIFDEVLDYMTMIGIVITLSAISVVILSKRDGEETLQKKVKRGILFSIIGAVAQALGLVFSKLGMGETVGAFEATQVRMIAAIIGFVLFITFRKEWKNVFLAFKDKVAMGYIFFGSIFGPFLGVTSSLLAMRYTSIGVSTTIAQLNVILIIPFSIFLFKEKVRFIEMIASIIAFIGVALLFL